MQLLHITIPKIPSIIEGSSTHTRGLRKFNSRAVRVKAKTKLVVLIALPLVFQYRDWLAKSIK
jgi:hypothetical protein